MAKTVSDAVARALEGRGFLRLALRHDLINYSALARFIFPAVRQDLGREPTSDAVIMAVRRYAKSIARDDRSEKFLRAVGDSKVVLRTGVSAMHFNRTPPLYSQLVEIEQSKVNWHRGDKMYVLQRSDEIMVIASHKLVPLVVSAGRGALLEQQDGLALITIEWGGMEVNEIPGTIAFVADEFARLSVNIRAVFNTRSKMSFLTSEKDAPRAYEGLNRAFEECRFLLKEA